jgi:CheY-like chemotaxis protein
MNNRNLLLVEDDPQDERLTLRALNKVNVANRIDVVRDGAEALDYLFCRGDFSERNTGDQPAVILLDLKLPKLTGLEVLEQLRADEHTRLLPAVVLTSSDEEQDLITSYKLGANSYVRKPLDFTEFSEAVANLGMHWLVLNQVPDNWQ